MGRGLIFYKELIAQYGDPERVHFRLSTEARAEAKQYQDSARVQTTDDVDLPTIKDFLDEPVRVQEYVSADGYEDMEADDFYVQRVCALPYQIIEQALGEELPRNESARRSRSTTVGMLMNRIPGWTAYAKWAAEHEIKDKITIPGYLRGRGYVREDATPEEIKRGYRIIETEEDEDLI